MDRESAVEGFRYDAWANSEWADGLARLDPKLVAPEAMAEVTRMTLWPDFPTGDPVDRAGAVFAHILFAERLWLHRTGTSLDLNPADAKTWIEALREGWTKGVLCRDPDEPIPYHNLSGQPFTWTYREIVAHVLRHGAYHRGQLREIAENAGLDPIPQT